MEQRILDKELHIKYWQRCLKSLLPTQYTSSDSSRMTLGFFILSALDILDESIELPTHSEKSKLRDWILKCQHPNGGFCGSPNHKFPNEYYVTLGEGFRDIDPANLPATFFAILSLGLLGDLRGVDRMKCLRWLRRLQREDGSFGEVVTPDGKILGGRDMRYCYVATATRWMLKGDREGFEEDIDVENLVQHIRSSQTYDGGISESSQHEAHAGYTYCAVATLSFLNRLSSLNGNPTKFTSGIVDMTGILRWLVSRQICFQRHKLDENEGIEGIVEENNEVLSQGIPLKQDTIFDETISASKEYIGFNGRCGKQVDTCYTFWVIASLNLLYVDQERILDHNPSREFLIQQTQHRIGGFSKYPGDPPDIYHSYLGLAALATMNEPNIKRLDPALCVSVEQKYKIARLRDELLMPTKLYWKHGYCFSIREDDPEFNHDEASNIIADYQTQN